MSSTVNLPDAFLSIDTDSAHALRNGFANHAFENMMKGEGTSFLDEMLNAHDSHDQGHKQGMKKILIELCGQWLLSNHAEFGLLPGDTFSLSHWQHFAETYLLSAFMEMTTEKKLAVSDSYDDSLYYLWCIICYCYTNNEWVSTVPKQDEEEDVDDGSLAAPPMAAPAQLAGGNPDPSELTADFLWGSSAGQSIRKHFYQVLASNLLQTVSATPS